MNLLIDPRRLQGGYYVVHSLISLGGVSTGIDIYSCQSMLGPCVDGYVGLRKKDHTRGTVGLELVVMRGDLGETGYPYRGL